MSDCVVDCDETGILPSGSIGGLNFIQQAAPFATTGCNCELLLEIYDRKSIYSDARVKSRNGSSRAFWGFFLCTGQGARAT